jgi:hypothetical protein
MSSEPTSPRVPQQAGRTADVSRRALWFGLLGGPLAWLFHLLSAYLLGEFGCLTRLAQVKFLDISGVAWALIGVSVLWLAVAAASTWAGYRSTERLSELEVESDELTAAGGRHLARVGFISSALFTFIILAQAVPIFFHLREC